MSSPLKSVTIIGAGLGGLVLALSLKKFGIEAKIIELREPEYSVGGAIMMSPNSLRVLDSLDAYEPIRKQGFPFQALTFKTDHDQKTTGRYYFGDKAEYGYDAQRVYRTVLLVELRRIVTERGIPIEYGKKFSHVISEDDNGVKFALADGTEEDTGMLIGADGIHSKVRKYLWPNIEPLYSGFVGVTYAIPRSMLRLPTPDYEFPASIHGATGAFVLAPQKPDGHEMFIGRQFPYQPQDRYGWDALLKDKPQLIEMHQQDLGSWSDLVSSGQEAAGSPEAHSFNIWAYHTVPKIDNWASKSGRVILLGDAAHAIPPSSGQGANQAFEDSYSLAVVLKSLGTNLELTKTLTKWQDYRQERINKVLVLSKHMEVLRLSEEEKKSLTAEQLAQSTNYNIGSDGQLSWLYSHEIEKELKIVLAS
jgi:2-polyprenyl-6-methoxyphenol hydroxylase-like FAD-dependent oxidoreductase